MKLASLSAAQQGIWLGESRTATCGLVRVGRIRVPIAGPQRGAVPGRCPPAIGSEAETRRTPVSLPPPLRIVAGGLARGLRQWRRCRLDPGRHPRGPANVAKVGSQAV